MQTTTTRKPRLTRRTLAAIAACVEAAALGGGPGIQQDARIAAEYVRSMRAYRGQPDYLLLPDEREGA